MANVSRHKRRMLKAPVPLRPDHEELERIGRRRAAKERRDDVALLIGAAESVLRASVDPIVRVAMANLRGARALLRAGMP